LQAAAGLTQVSAPATSDHNGCECEKPPGSFRRFVSAMRSFGRLVQ
jgi:hypothetical protein